MLDKCSGRQYRQARQFELRDIAARLVGRSLCRIESKVSRQRPSVRNVQGNLRELHLPRPRRHIRPAVPMTDLGCVLVPGAAGAIAVRADRYPRERNGRTGTKLDTTLTARASVFCGEALGCHDGLAIKRLVKSELRC
jgi:hypothetical protein